ncbi:hypothetical protein CWB89_15760 [Pseudoalteromonas piscicida]|uniref:Dicarboxylate transport domain-containing protein n=1 Tax=Pseudoalteromonas piscicida TaxID=43662 RepID=A0AAQ2EST4_PSEO7|nr:MULTISPECIES: YdbH domain-containing protein [Pseudoalteromonas]KJY87622.1 signal peptide protein [Pseudoalteromonas piscicida]TMN36355.1 hypothetical protein CWB94_18885 [Pseudoalteromonas piscicida]TMN45499.1 hypothetical protein CWB95_00890 [Pseudoalteromonas piscicida]TMN46965.1 hypothetical protein CWB92_21170 [Pseudoalteromonas piscicida]TMN47015.1 hypothetical protein CWB91_22205 [Pseudoalteromonas piscicida]
MKKWLWSLVLILSVFVGVYLARVPLSLWAIKHFIPVNELQVSCLDWRLSGLNRIHITKACVQTNAFNAQLYDAQLSMRQVNIEKADIQLLPPKKSDATQPQRLALPLDITRPKTHIAKLSVSGEPLPKPLVVSISESELNQFVIAGDIDAEVTLQPERIAANIDLSGEYLSALLPPQIQALSGTSQLEFDGLAMDAELELETLVALEQAECKGTVAYIGALSGRYDLATQQGKVALAEPISAKSVLDCLTSEYSKLLPTTWQVHLPREITISADSIATDLLEVTGKDKPLQLEVNELAVDLTEPFVNGDIRLEFFDDKWGAHTLSGALSARPNFVNMSGEITTDLQKLTLQDVIAENLELNSRFKISGNPTELITIEAQPSIFSTQLSTSGLVIDNPSLTLDLHAQLDVPKLKSGHLLHRVLPEGMSFAITLDSKLQNLSVENVTAKQSALSGRVVLEPTHDFDINLNLTSAQIQQQSYKLNEFAQTLHWQGSVATGEIFSTLSGNTKVAEVNLADFSLKNVSIDSKGQQSRGLMASHVINIDGVKALLEHQYSSLKHPAQLHVPTQQLTQLQPYIDALLPNLKISNGNFSAVVEGDLSTRIFTLDGSVQNGSALFNERLIQNATIDVFGLLSSANIQLKPTTLSVEELRAGVIVQAITGQLLSEAGVAKLKDINAQVFAGNVEIDEVSLVSTPQVVQVSLDKLSLELIAASGHDAGVELKGLISGTLPVQLSSSGVRIDSGKIHSVGEGLLKVENNASINALKEQQPSLQTVIGVLDELTIEQLSSGVNLSEDGWLDLDVKITGINKLQQQPVNFNYTHSENVFTLLRALRLSDEITREVENALNKEER